MDKHAEKARKRWAALLTKPAVDEFAEDYFELMERTEYLEEERQRLIGLIGAIEDLLKNKID